MNTTQPVQLVEGYIRDLDLTGRCILVFANDDLVDVDLPPGCPIFVRAERVKLRLLQEMDWVQVETVRREGRVIAQSVRVDRSPRPGSGTPALAVAISAG